MANQTSIKKKLLKRIAAPTAVVAMTIAGAGTVSAGFSSYNDVQPQQQTSRNASQVGNHSISADDCGGPVNIDLRVDIEDDPDKSEGVRMVFCNSSANNQAGVFDSRIDGRRGHFLQNVSGQRVDLDWNFPG